MQTKFIIFFILFVLMSPLVSAVNVIPTQEKINITIERGREYSFSLVVENLTTATNITANGSASSWITFGPNNGDHYYITNLVDQSVKVTIFVPSSTETGTYKTFINANGQSISQINVNVVAETHALISNLKNEIENLKSKIQTLTEEQGTLKSETQSIKDDQDRIRKVQESIEELVKTMNRKVENVESYQKSLSDIEAKFNKQKAELEKQVEQLQNKAQQLEEKNKILNEMTGNLTVRETSFKLLLVIIVIGIIIAVLLPENKKAKILNKLKVKISLKEKIKRLKFLKKKPEENKYSFRIEE